MTGTRARWQASSIRALNAWLLKGAPSRPGKIKGDPREVYSPTPQRYAFHTFEKGEPFLERGRQFLCERQITERAAFDLETCSNNHLGRFSHEPVYRESCPLVKSAPSEEERGGEVVCQMPKVATAILAELAQELP
jgi:hypothetical protein